MRAIVSELLLWHEGGSLVARLRSNADAASLRRRLREGGLEGLVQRLEACLDATHENGGSGYLLVFVPGASRGAVEGCSNACEERLVVSRRRRLPSRNNPGSTGPVSSLAC